jgi:hypothetical protein
MYISLLPIGKNSKKPTCCYIIDTAYCPHHNLVTQKLWRETLPATIDNNISSISTQLVGTPRPVPSRKVENHPCVILDFAWQHRRSWLTASAATTCGIR